LDEAFKTFLLQPFTATNPSLIFLNFLKTISETIFSDYRYNLLHSLLLKINIPFLLNKKAIFVLFFSQREVKRFFHIHDENDTQIPSENAMAVMRTGYHSSIAHY